MPYRMERDMLKANKLMMSAETMSSRSAFLGVMTKRALLALLWVNICLIIYYIVFNYQGYFHSDSAVKNLLAQEIYETGQYFPTDWYYVNSDLFVLFGHTYILPLLPFFSNSFSLHAVSGIISATLILMGTWCVADMLTESYLGRLLSVVVVSSGISGFMAENLYGQVSYGAMYYITCFIIFFAWRFLNEESKVRWAWGAGMATFVGLAFWSNPQRAVASYGLPLVVAGVVYIAIELRQSGGRWSTQAFRGISLLSLFFIGAAAGVALHLLIIRGVNNISGTGFARWLPLDEMLKNVGYTLQGILFIFGGIPTASRTVVSLLGAYDATRLISAITLIVLLPYGLVMVLRGQNKGTLFFSVFTLVLALLALFLQITTSIPDMSNPFQSARYLALPSLLLLLLFIAIVVGGKLNWHNRVAGSVALFVLATGAFSSLMSSDVNNQSSWGISGKIQDNRTRLIKYLASNGLHYGYASYWNAGTLSVLSSQQVRVRQIRVDKGLPIPMRHLSSERWYRPSAWVGETFLLLHENESKTVNWDLLAAYHGKPTRELRFGDRQIYVFPNNIAIGLPNWDQRFKTPVRFYVFPQSLHNVGRYIVAGKQAALVADKGEAGYLLFGPYISMLPGSYKVSFDVEATGYGVSDFGKIDVVSGGGQQTYVSTSITDRGRQSIDLDFMLKTRVDALEYRVLTTGVGQVKVYGISVVRTGD